MSQDENNMEEIKSKKETRIKRVWKRMRSINWKDPLNRWKLLFFLIIAFFGITGGTYGAIAATSTNTFCASCHEMGPEAVTHQYTSHSQVKCVDCHIKPGVTNTLKSKIGAMKELYSHVTTVPNPIYPHKQVADVNCIECHSRNRMVTATGDLVVNHDGHIEAEIACITCHAGVAHAKVVERGLNTHDTYDYWTEENANVLISTDYTNPNMGTCIDCHDKVNQGLQPWDDDAYVMSKPPKLADSADGHGEDIEDKVYTSNLILQGLGKQVVDVQLSMECLTCHLEVGTPESHQKTGWNQAHGGQGLKELNTCIDCHDEAKWIRKVATSPIDELLNPSSQSLDDYTPNIDVVKNESRASIFCSTCHTERPPAHVNSDEWLTSHAVDAVTDEEKQQCVVCHDVEKPLPEEFDATTDVYCEFCHRTGFKQGE